SLCRRRKCIMLLAVIRPPPPSTPFPYTTLFRSLDGFERYQREDAWTWEHMALCRARPVFGPPEARERVETIVRDVLAMPRDPDKDRKSTRLNSSHVKISYAVFCLKKKTEEGGKA